MLRLFAAAEQPERRSGQNLFCHECLSRYSALIHLLRAVQSETRVLAEQSLLSSLVSIPCGRLLWYHGESGSE